MEELLLKVAEILDISVEGLLTHYPTLRTQIQWHTSLGTLGEMSMVLAVAIGVVILVVGVVKLFIQLFELSPTGFRQGEKRLSLKPYVITTLVLFVFSIIVFVVRPWVTPDVVTLNYLARLAR